MDEHNSLALFVEQNPEMISATAGYLVGMTDGLVKDLIGLAGGEQIKIWRLERSARAIHAAKKRLQAEGIIPQQVSPAVGLPLLQAAALEDREDLLNLWVKLLAASMDPRRADHVRQSYITAIKTMDPTDALVFSSLSSNGNNNSRETLATRLQRNVTEVDISRENLVTLRCCWVSPTQRHPDGNYSHMHLTSFGMELRRILGTPAV